MPPRGKTGRTNYFGCWTCRARKVKCDNVRPRCRRCGDSCAGYDIELYWLDGNTERPAAVKRRRMFIYDPNLPVECAPIDIDQMLWRLDDAIDVDGKGIIGPFTAWEAEGYNKTNAIRDKQTLRVQATQIAECLLGLVRPNLATPSTYVSTTAAKLMDNYINVVSNVLQPAFHPQNPYTTIYVSRAVQSGALIVGGSCGSWGSEALFHALLSVSAFHLHRSQGDKSKYYELAQTSRLRAVNCLQNALTSEEKTEDYDTILSAMMSLVSIDLMEGGMTEFWIHLDGCGRLLGILQAGKTEKNRQLLSICSFMNTLSRSTNPHHTPKPYTMGRVETVADLLQHSPFNADDHCLEFTYGTTSRLASYLQLTINLADNVSFYSESSEVCPLENLAKAKKVLRRSIYRWNTQMKKLKSVCETDHKTRHLITCHIVAFHAALVIYYHTVLDWPIDQENMRYYKKVCLSSLLDAEYLKVSAGAREGWSAMAPIVWPGFIASCEADPDERPQWRSWWTDIQRYYLGSIHTLWTVVQEVWFHREWGMEEVPGWKGVLRRGGKRVMSGG